MKEAHLIAEFQIVNDRFNEALTSNNPELIAACLSDDWILVEPEFGIIDKDRFLHVIAEKELTHSEMKKTVLKVKLVSDAAIVITKGINKGCFRGQLFNAEQWVTNVYKKENENWICVMTQEAPASCK